MKNDEHSNEKIKGLKISYKYIGDKDEGQKTHLSPPPLVASLQGKLTLIDVIRCRCPILATHRHLRLARRQNRQK